jgi:type VI secretion system protein ImpA
MIDVEALLAPLSDESPCGDNLEYDAQFGELERAAVGKPEQQFGSTIVPAEEPKWKEVHSLALELLTRTKDFRVAAELARAELALSGFIPFLRSLHLMCGYIEQFWDTVHPQLDPDDDNDPVFRVNTLESLCDEEKTLRPVRMAAIVSSRSVGRFSLRDVAIANGELTAPEGAEAPDWSKINAAFEDCDVEEIKANSDAVLTAVEHLTTAQRTFNEHVGAGNGINLTALLSLLKSAGQVYSDQLVRRGVSPTGDETEEGAAADGASDGGGGGEASVKRLSGDITTRDDVVRCIDKIVEYYQRYEPSSPLPLLLQRCKKLVSASFLEIIQDLAPDVLSQISAMGGQQLSDSE